jgi:quinoprotein glucose dehydrogenase
MPSRFRCLRTALSALLAAPAALVAQTSSADWPVYGGNTDNTHFTTLSQITPANVSRLKVAWTYQT